MDPPQQPVIKEQSRQWVSPGERAPKNAKGGLSANKVMAAIILRKTIIGEYYSELLDRFNIDFK